MAGMTPRDLGRLAWPSDPQLHPDARRVAWVRTHIDLEDDCYRSSIWLWDGKTQRQFTAGTKDSTPRWSPEGRNLAFLRAAEDDDDAMPQLLVMRADGGEPRIVTDLSLGAGTPVWSPDGSRIAMTADTHHEDTAAIAQKRRAKRAKRITELGYRQDDEGWLHDRETHIWLVDPDGEPGDEACLTPGDEWSEHGVVWSPDGTSLAFTSTRNKDREFHPSNQVFTIALAGGSPTPVTNDRGEWSTLVWDDQGLSALGLMSTFDWPATPQLFRLHGQTPEPVDAGDRTLGGGTPGFHGGLIAVDDGLVTAREDGGRQSLVLIGHDGSLTTLLDGDRCVTGGDVSGDGAVAVVTVTDPRTPGELIVIREGVEQTITAFGADIADLIRPTERFIVEHDGIELDAWAVLPEGDGPWPVLLNIHGGPTSQYGDYFFDEFQMYAAAGYLVVGGNPRGASGHGSDFSSAVVGEWGIMDSLDMLDLLAILDRGLVRFAERADRDRLGIMGGSYGGYATARIMTFDHRFKAGIVERGLLQWESFAGTSDIGAYFDRMFLGASTAADIELSRAASPVTVADRISTPTLVLHSESDLRCPIEQAEQFFTVLRRNDVPAWFVRFPGEGHELSRSGSPHHRVERFDVILNWLGRWLDNPWTTDSLREFEQETNEG